MKHEERRDQILLVAYARRKYPGIRTMISPIVFYGGNLKQRLIQGKIMKDMGYEKGTLDVFFAKARGEFNGLFIELKKIKGSKTSDDQLKMVRDLIAEGYCAVVCKGYEEAVKMLDGYMNGQLKVIEEP